MHMGTGGIRTPARFTSPPADSIATTAAHRSLPLASYAKVTEVTREGPKVCGLTGGGNRIRTIGPAEKERAVERGPAADLCRLATRPVFNDPSSLSVRRSPSATTERPFARAVPMVRIRFPPARSLRTIGAVRGFQL